MSRYSLPLPTNLTLSYDSANSISPGFLHVFCFWSCTGLVMTNKIVLVIFHCMTRLRTFFFPNTFISMIWHASNTWDVIPWILNYARVATGSIELLKYTIKLKTHMYQMKPYFLLSNTQSSRPISRFSILQFPFFFSSYLFDRLYGVLFSATLRHMTLKLIGLSTWLWRNMLLKCVRVQSVFI